MQHLESTSRHGRVYFPNSCVTEMLLRRSLGFLCDEVACSSFCPRWPRCPLPVRSPQVGALCSGLKQDSSLFFLSQMQPRSFLSMMRRSSLFSWRCSSQREGRQSIRWRGEPRGCTVHRPSQPCRLSTSTTAATNCLRWAAVCTHCWIVAVFGLLGLIIWADFLQCKWNILCH